MAFVHGNQLWKNRSKHGREILFATPQLLWDEACEYFKWCDENPLKDTRSFASQFVQRPYTLRGLCQFLNCNSHYFNDFKHNCSNDFSEVIINIEDVIFTQKFELASIGVFKENIIARELGISEKIEAKTQVTKEVDYSNLSDEDLQSLANAIEKLNEH